MSSYNNFQSFNMLSVEYQLLTTSYNQNLLLLNLVSQYENMCRFIDSKIYKVSIRENQFFLDELYIRIIILYQTIINRVSLSSLFQINNQFLVKQDQYLIKVFKLPARYIIEEKLRMFYMNEMNKGFIF